MLGRYDDAHAHFHRALDLYGEFGDGTSEGDMRRSIAITLHQQGRHEEALDHAQWALELYRATGDQVGQIRAFNAVGWCHALLGNYQQALTYCERAITQHQEKGTGDGIGEAAAWHSLGYTHHNLGDRQQALVCYQHALDRFRDNGIRYHEADTLVAIGDVHAAGEQELAREAWRQAVDILDQLGHPAADRVRAKLT